MRAPVFALVLALVLALAVAAPAPAGDVVAARTLRPGTVLTAADLRGPDDALAEFVGLEARRAIYAGRPVRAGDLGPETLVRRNAIVTLRFASGGLMIRTEARALDAGGLGERVRAINLESRHRIVGVVRGPGLVEVTR